MVHSSQLSKHHLQPLNTHWHNRSLSSLSATSEAATFHSAHANLSNMELRQLTTHQPSPFTSLPTSTTPLPLAQFTATKMDRQDSGYSETPASPVSDSRRTSTSSTTRRNSRSSSSRPKRRTTNSSSTSSNTRPSTKRVSRCSAQVRTSTSGTRPLLHARHTTPYASQQPYQFFQFPSLADVSPPPPEIITPPPPPPPATVQYWTSDSTRRLEYAAIDAASKGVRGFFIKLLPDCILPKGTKRTRFHCENGDGDSDAGSVRRYRLALPEEKDCGMVNVVGGEGVGQGKLKRPGVLRRWTTFGRRGNMD